MRNVIVSLAVLAAVACCCVSPLLLHGGLTYVQDMTFHVFQAGQFDTALREGTLCPRWSPDSNGGYGGPNFIFYSPLAYYLVSALKVFTDSLEGSMLAVLWLGFFLSGASMCVALRRTVGEGAAVLIAAVYQVLPFHLADLYRRGAFCELFAFVWFPLIALFLFRVFDGRKRSDMAGLSLSYAGLVLTHLASAFMFSFLIAAGIIHQGMSGRWKSSLRVAIAAVAGLGVSSVFLVPAAIERKFIQIHRLIAYPFGNYENNFLFTWSKIRGASRDFYIPLQAGLLVEVLVFLGVVLLIRWRERPVKDYSPGLFILAFLISLFLTAPVSAPLWRVAPGLPLLQFPWRWISVMEVALCFLIGSAAVSGGPSLRSPDVRRRALVYLTAPLFLGGVFVLFTAQVPPQDRSPRRWLIPEYAPVWASDLDLLEPVGPSERIAALSGAASWQIEKWQSERRVVMVRAETPIVLRIATFYYPGWKARLDGEDVRIGIQKGSGAMLVSVPPGRHILSLSFGETPLRHYAGLASLASLALLGILVAADTRGLRGGAV